MMSPNFFAATYNCGAYGASTFENGTACTTSTTGGTTTAAGVLTNTGFDILLAVTVACVITFAALLVRFWKRPSSHPATPSAE